MFESRITFSKLSFVSSVQIKKTRILYLLILMSTLSSCGFRAQTLSGDLSSAQVGSVENDNGDPDDESAPNSNTGTDGGTASSQINIHFEGQSNALLAADGGAIWIAKRIIEAAFPGIDVHWQYAWGRESGHNIINSGTSLMYWTRGGWWPSDGDNHIQQGAWDFVSELPADVRANPTVIYRLHTEDDGNEDFQYPGQYEDVVRSHITELRARYGQSPSTTPVVFGVVPYGRLQGSWMQVYGGLQQLANDSSFHARIGTATDNGSWSDGSHYKEEFMDELGQAIADDLLPAVSSLGFETASTGF